MALLTSNPALADVRKKVVPLVDVSIPGVVFAASCLLLQVIQSTLVRFSEQ